MVFDVQQINELHVPFVAAVYNENIEILHGAEISRAEWQNCLLNEPDPDEINFIITANGEYAAWLKLNGLTSRQMYISMLVVAKKYQHIGVGSFAVQFAEYFAKKNGKVAVRIQTTIDNTAAKKCYLKNGFKILGNIRYSVGDGIEREGIVFEKKLKNEI